MTEVDSRPETGRRVPLHRRRYIVDKPFQHRLIATLMSVWIVNSLFFTIVLYFIYEGHLERFYSLVPRRGMRPLLELPMLLPLSMAFVCVFGFIVLGMIAVYMSNQIAGPLYRTKLCMERVGKGDFGFQLRFRQGDFLREIPDVFNAMVEGLKRQAEADVDEVCALEQALDDPVALRRLLHEFRQRKEKAAGREARKAAPVAPRQVTMTVS